MFLLYLGLHSWARVAGDPPGGGECTALKRGGILCNLDLRSYARFYYAWMNYMGYGFWQITCRVVSSLAFTFGIKFQNFFWCWVHLWGVCLFDGSCKFNCYIVFYIVWWGQLIK